MRKRRGNGGSAIGSDASRRGRTLPDRAPVRLVVVARANRSGCGREGVLGERSSGLLAAVLGFALVVSGCGSDSDGGRGAAAPAATAAAPTATAATAATEAPEPPAEPVSVGLVFDIGGRGDQSFNDSAYAGLERAANELGAAISDASPNSDGSNRAELLRLSADVNDLVIGVGFLFADSLTEVAAEYPDTNFGIVDGWVEAPNVASLGFAEHEGSFLVGAAAGLKSTTGLVGYIGGVTIDLIGKFEAGFVAGVAEIGRASCRERV